MTTVDRLLISVLVTVLATTTAVRIGQDERLNDSFRIDATVAADGTSLGTGSGIEAGTDHRVSIDLAPVYDLGMFDPETRAVIEASIELYDEAGLALPPIEFISCDDRSDCRGRAGMVLHRENGPELRLCHDTVTPMVEWVIIHELAHCWDRHQLTDDVREAFLELRGLDGWREGEWHERGAEHAAEVMVWGLIDRPVRPCHIDQNSCEELLAGYTTLTGRLPLHGHEDACR